jgi:hypothetical protein
MDGVDIVMFAMALALAGAAIWAGVTFIKGNALSKVMGATCFLAAAVCLYVAGRGGFKMWRSYRQGSGGVMQNPLVAANNRAIAAGNAAANVVRVNMPNPNNVPQLGMRI